MAVTWRFAARASTSSASESAPPETAQVTSVPPSGNRQRASSEDSRAARSAATAVLRDRGSEPLDPELGIADLEDRGQVGRVEPRPVEQGHATRGLDGRDELLALLVLVDLG